MAGRWGAAGALPQAGGLAAASDPAAGRAPLASSRHCSICRARRSCPCRLMAVGHAASRRSLSTPGDIGRARVGENRPLEDATGVGRSELRSGPHLPREDRDLFIAANNGHVLVFDNLSGLPSWLSDALCRLASGGGFAVRRLYTDQDEVLFDAARPIILNGIEDVITRPDLADRALFLTLPPISEAHRRPEKDLWREFDFARPRLLGALLDAASHGLRTRPHVRLDRLPRMADFAQWAAACETALWPAGTFSRAYAGNRRAPLKPWSTQIRWPRVCGRSWPSGPRGRAPPVDLLRAAAVLAADGLPRSNPDWPKNPRALAGRLRRAQTALRTLGIEITFSREGRAGTRIIRMSKSPEYTVSTDSSVGNNGLDQGST